MSILNFGDLDVVELPTYIPECLPVTMRDMDMDAEAGRFYDLFLHMADPCPGCGAFNMLVGDYACCGYCHVCSGGTP